MSMFDAASKEPDLTMIHEGGDTLTFKGYSFSKRKMFFFLCFTCILIGTCFRFIHVYMTAFDVSKHDLGYIAGLDNTNVAPGHLGYIEYICKNLSLPDFNPTSKWSFYNPPFFHICAATVLKVATSLGAAEPLAWEIVQYLPAIFILLSVIGVYKILRLFEIDGIPLLLGVALCSFHPSLSYLSAALNNDALSLALTVWAVYFAVRWYKAPSFKLIIGLALCIGFGMMTKLTVALIAPPVAILFIVRLFKDKKWKKYIAQFGIFAVICVPVGLFWSIRNLLLYKIPITYVQALPKGSAQDVSGYSLWERIGIPKLSEFMRIDSSWSPSSKIGFPDHNIWSQTLRTSLFDDNALNWTTDSDRIWASILMLLTLVLAVTAVVLTFIGLVRAKNIDPVLRIFIGSSFAVLILNFLKFCFDFPMTCTIHFRYLVPCLLYCSVGIGMWWSSSKKKLSTLIIRGTTVRLVLFVCVISSFLYLNCFR